MHHVRLTSSVLLVVVLTLSASYSVRVSASMMPASAAPKKVCKTVTKKVHGKEKRVKVCKTVKPKPAPTPLPTSTPVPNNAPFGKIAGLAIDPQGNVYLTDMGNCRVVKLSPSGHFLMTFGTFPTCDPSSL